MRNVSQSTLHHRKTETGMHLHEIDYVLAKLRWMREHRVWPKRFALLWTDAFGLTLLLSSLYSEFDEQAYSDDAEKLVSER